MNRYHHRQNQGVVLIVVLWVLVVLALIAWGLSRRSSMEVSVLETARGKLRSYAAARAGIDTLLDRIEQAPSVKDTLYASGIALEAGVKPESILGRIDTGQNAYAKVTWLARNFNGIKDKGQWVYGLSDEGGRININAITAANYQILSALFVLKGLSQAVADKLALAVMRYSGVSGAGGDFKQEDDALLKPKNRPYENILELLEVDGMSPTIFDTIKDDVTVYGNAQMGLWINTDTANNDVLQAVAMGWARMNPTANSSDIITQAYALRDGADGRSFSVDDGAVSIATVNTRSWPVMLQEGVSNYYRARVVGVDASSGTRTVIEAVIHHVQGSAGTIVAWQRD